MPYRSITVLLVENDLADQMAFRRMVTQEELPYHYQAAGSIAEAQRILDQHSPDVIILDHEFPDGTAFDLLDAINGTPFIITTAAGSEELALAAMQQGATDYIIKDPERHYLRKLPLTIQRVLRQKQTEGALRSSERRYHSLLQHLPVGVYRTTPDGHIIEANLAAAHMFGFESLTAFKKQNVKTLYLDAVDRTDHLQRLAREPSTPNVFPMRRRDGTLIWVRDYPRAVQDSQGAVVWYDGILIDVTTYKRAEEEIHQLDLAVTNAMNGIARLNTEGCFVMVKEQYARMLGYAPDELLGQSWQETVPSEDHPSAITACQAMLETGQAEVECRARRKDGSVFDKHLLLVKTTDERGHHDGHYCFMRDVTAHKRAEETRRASEERYRSLVENQPDLVCQFKPDGTLTYVNRAYADYFGQAVEIMQTFNLFDLLPRKDRRALRAHLDTMGPENLVAKIEHQVMLPSGEMRWQEWTDRAFVDAAGAVVEFQSIGRDITERKRAEETIRKKQNLLSLALKTAGAGAWEWNVKTNHVTWSDENYFVLGLTPGSCEASYDNWIRCVHPDDQELILQHIAESLEKRQDLDLDYRIVWPDGTVRWINDKGKLLLNDRGEPEHVYGFQIDITERRQAEEALKERETQYRLLMEESPFVIQVYTPDGTLVQVNKAWEVMWGARAEDAIGTYNALRDPQLEALGLKPFVERSFAGERVVYEECWFDPSQSDMTGRERWVRAQSYPILDEQGHLKNVVLLVEDITERKQATGALQASEEFNRRMVEAIPSGIVHVSAQGAILYANDEAQRILGLSFDELTQSYVAGFEPRTIWEDGSPCPVEDYPVSRCLQTGETQPQVTIGVHRPDDTITWAVYTAVPLLDSRTQQVSGAVVTFLDITDRKQAEQALQASEGRNRALVDGIPDMMFRLRADGTFLDYKAESVEELAIPPEAIIGNSLAELPMPDTFIEDLMGCVEQAITTGEAQAYEYELAVPIGLQTYEARIVCSGVDEVVCIVRNVTERKRTEEEREHLIDELEARNAELERFTYTVSHDLKTPLVTIKGFLGMLQQDAIAGNEAALKRDVEQISGAADRMARLLNELLELSRIGRVINPAEEVPLSELVHETLDLVADQICEGGITVEVAPDLPVVFGDRIRLLEVLQNLIDNAIKFMGDQPSPHIEIGSRTDGSDVVCYVRDNGIGIAPRHHDKVFGLFNRLNVNVDGTGIGLALVKRIVEIHGGRIWVESAGEGHGSAFCFTLPG